MSYSANVSFSSLRSSLSNLPENVSSVLFNSNMPAQHVVIELTLHDRKGTVLRTVSGKPKKVFVGWTGLSTTKRDPRGDGLIEIDSAFGTALGLENNQKVTINIHANPSQATRVFLDPVGIAEWEIVETHASYLESWMINQVRAVSPGQVITVYPSPTSSASLTVVGIEPSPASGFAILSPDSEIVIAPKTKKTQAAQQDGLSRKSLPASGKKKERISASGILLRGISLPSPAFELPEQDISPPCFNPTIYVDPQSALPLRNISCVKVSLLEFPVVVNGDKHGSATIPVNTAPSGQSETESEDSSKITGPNTYVIARLIESDQLPSNHAGISNGLAVALGLGSNSFGEIIRIEPASKPIGRNPPKKIIVHPYIVQTASNKSLKLEGQKNKPTPKEKTAEKSKLQAIFNDLGITDGPITHRQQIPACDTTLLPLGGLINLEKADGWLTDGQNIPVEIGEEILRPQSLVCTNYANSLSDNMKEENPRPVVGINKTLDAIKESVKNGGGGTLVYGSRGAGKTSVLKEIVKDLNDNLIYTIWFSCSFHAEKPVQYMKDTFKRLFQEAAWYSPSVIILDDLEKILGAELEHAAAASSKFRQLAEIFRTCMESALETRNITVLASAASKESIHSTLIINHALENMFHLKSPDRDVRATVLTEALTKVSHTGVEVVDIAGSTEGFQPGDLWTLVDRARHEAVLEGMEKLQHITLTNKHFDKALKDFTPSSLRGVKLQKSSTSWADIGGLKEAKSVILETLEWPTKYAPIFASSPLRLRSGLLLYGYPGCGKTFLASAVAAQCGLNFISVKGPEILNKYIGASEQSVRDLFERAQAAKPCVLFFDEFDSIAPKRGHDSTGVTDRVVNQMLTQMDGAEGLDGVYVLAATSRPDLIDSALLRPGRLDKSLICDLPSFEDRVDILEAVRRNMSVSPHINLEYLAEHTEGYSGADLQALLYNAHLLAVHERLDAEDEQEKDNDQPDRVEFFQLQGELSIKEELQTKKILENIGRLANGAASEQKEVKDSKHSQPVVIEEKHMEQALKDTKPSISVKEKLKLSRVYQEFVSGRDGNLPSGTASNEIGGRATLM